MRKTTILFFACMTVVAVVLLAMARSHDFVPYDKVLKWRINATTMHTLCDYQHSTEIQVPGIFTREVDTMATNYRYARFAYYPEASRHDAKGEITLEYCAEPSTGSCNWTSRLDSTALPDGYLNFSKTIRHEDMTYTYALTYPSAYDDSVLRLKNKVRRWKALSHRWLHLKK